MEETKIKAIIKEEVRKVISEMSLNRVREMAIKYDTGFVTSNRDEATKAENSKNNKILKAFLRSRGYGVTSVRGAWIETNKKTGKKKEVAENSFFVVDLTDSGNLKQYLFKQGELYDQDSIIYNPKGNKKVQIVGTNKFG